MEARDAAKHPAMGRKKNPTTHNYLAHNVHSAQVETNLGMFVKGVIRSVAAIKGGQSGHIAGEWSVCHNVHTHSEWSISGPECGSCQRTQILK